MKTFDQWIMLQEGASGVRFVAEMLPNGIMLIRAFTKRGNVYQMKSAEPYPTLAEVEESWATQRRDSRYWQPDYTGGAHQGDPVELK
jgi:hypothetical protein